MHNSEQRAATACYVLVRVPCDKAVPFNGRLCWSNNVCILLSISTKAKQQEPVRKSSHGSPPSSIYILRSYVQLNSEILTRRPTANISSRVLEHHFCADARNLIRRAKTSPKLLSLLYSAQVIPPNPENQRHHELYGALRPTLVAETVLRIHPQRRECNYT